MRDDIRPRAWPQLLQWAVEFVERENECLELSHGGPGGIIDDKDVSVDLADARRWLTEARGVLKC